MRPHSRRSRGYSYSRYQEPISFAIRSGAVLALAGVTLFFAGPVGYRLGLLSLSVAADRVFVWGANLAGIGALLALIGVFITFGRRREGRRGFGRALLAVAVGVVAFRAGGRLPLGTTPPAIHDVTTDMQHPPEYATVAQLRRDAPGLAYAGEALAAKQRTAYPDIQPLLLPVPQEQAFTQALAVVRDLGWTLVSADGSAGRIEASAATRLFGTVDDVVVRVSPADGGSRVDVRSTSREPNGPASNVGRVRALLDALRS
ncbi:MAG: DUF1499 domain-containing protein [Vicinamibacterales bacterium]